MDVSVGVFIVTVDNVFPVEGSVFLQRLVRPKAVGVDSQSLLLADRQQEWDRRFVCGLRWHHVAVVGSAVNQNEHWKLVLVMGSTPARGQTTRARRTVALAAFESGFHVEFVDLDRPFQRRPRRVQRSEEALDAAVDRFLELAKDE